MYYKLGLDIGTTTAKCVIFGDGLSVAGEASAEYKGLKVSHGNWAQQDAEGWWIAVKECIKKAIRASGIDGRQIQGVGVSGQGPSFLLLDAEGVPVWDCIIWMDRRTEGECREILKMIPGEQFYSITGNQMDAMYLPSKFLWLKKNHPDAYSRAKTMVSSNGFINYKLTGKHSFDRTSASFTLLYDVHEDCWSRELIEKLGLPEDIFPPIYDSSDVVGYITKEAAAELGLAEGVPVIAGTVDSLAGAVEAGVISGGSVLEVTGTSSAFIVLFDEMVTTPYLSTAVGLKKGVGGMAGPMSTTGAAYQWCRNILHSGEHKADTAYLEMEEEIEKDAPDPTKIVFLPYMSGERSPIWNGDARGVFFGISIETKRAQIYRSVMEGTSFALRDNIETARKAGAEISGIRSVGGCCNSDMWLKIKASVINMPIEIPKVRFGAPAGDALMLMPVIGEYASLPEAIEQCVEVGKTIYPVKEWVEHYDKMFKSYKSIYEHTVEDFSELAKLS